MCFMHLTVDTITLDSKAKQSNISTKFFIQLNNVNKLKKKNKVLPSYIDSPATRWHITGNPTSSYYSMKHLGQILRRGYWAVRPCFPEQQFQLSSDNTSQTVGKVFAWYWGGRYCPKSQHNCKSEGFELTNKSHIYYAFANHVYSLSPVTIYEFFISKTYLFFLIYANIFGYITHMCIYTKH